MRDYLDADVVIWLLRNRPEAVAFFQGLPARGRELCMSAIQRAEVVFHLRPSEIRWAYDMLALVQTEPIDQELVDAAAKLYWQWNPSHGIGRDDAILAACAMRSGGRIYTLNAKHFPMPGLDVVRPW